MPAAIELSHLSKAYSKRGSPPIQAVADLSLSVPTGQVIGFLGPNGAGKTTTIKMLCGLVEPTTGQATINGYDVRRQRSAAMRQIGAVLEGTRNIYWRLSAWQNLLYFGRLKGCWGRSLQQRAEQLLRELELWERRTDPVRDFSRGMQQKVAIACALVADPPIVLLDEPTLGLDVHAARTVKEWVKELAHKRGKTIVLTTHQLDMAEALCERVVIMRQGTMIVDEPTTTLLKLFQQAYYELRLDMPLAEATTQLSDLPLTNTTITAENGETLLIGALADDVTIYALLALLAEKQIPLLGVKRSQPTLEEVFVQVTQGQKEQTS